MKKYLLLVFMVGSLFIANAVLALSYRAPEPDPWYKIQLVIDQSSLPAEVSVVADRAIINRGNEPLYITLDGHRHKFVNSKHYFIWDEESGYREDLGNYYFFERTPGLQFERPIEDIRADNRPFDVVVPSPNRFTLPAEYKNKSIIIRGQAIYSLNPDYDPQALGKYEKTKPKAAEKIIGGGIAILIVGVLIRLALKKKKVL